VAFINKLASQLDFPNRNFTKILPVFLFSNEKSLIVMLALEENEHLNIAANNASYSEDDLVSRKSDGRAERREKEMSW
jgi:hypothetical protein